MIHACSVWIRLTASGYTITICARASARSPRARAESVPVSARESATLLKTLATSAEQMALSRSRKTACPLSAFRPCVAHSTRHTSEFAWNSLRRACVMHRYAPWWRTAQGGLADRARSRWRAVSPAPPSMRLRGDGRARPRAAPRLAFDRRGRTAAAATGQSGRAALGRACRCR